MLVVTLAGKDLPVDAADDPESDLEVGDTLERGKSGLWAEAELGP